MKTNVIIKVVAIVAAVIVVVVAMKAGRGGGTKKASEETNLSAIESGPAKIDNGLTQKKLGKEFLEKSQGVDTDSPIETMRTLTNEMLEMRRSSDQLVSQNKELKQEIKRLLSMEEALNNRVSGNLKKTERQVEDKQRQLEKEQAQSKGMLEKLKQKVDEYTSGGGNKSAGGYAIDEAGIPKGLGYDDSGQPVNYDEVVWINPMDAKISDKSGGGIELPNFISKRVDTAIERNSIANSMPGSKDKDKDRYIKAYTLPMNGTLIGSVGMTALVGRIPSGGSIRDPYPFKVIIGEENLSSNGIKIPNVSGIKMTGVSSGDWTLGCVSGSILSMTFTFRDGTISTFPDPKIKNKEPIAWISDKNGIPCVTGQRVTNAVSFLTQRVGLTTASAYASAAAQAEVTNLANVNGSSSVVTGDPNIYAKNTAIGEGINEVTDWLDKRQSNSFDAIYAPPGTEVAIHLSKQIPIDYDLEGRKVNHYANIERRSDNHLD